MVHSYVSTPFLPNGSRYNLEEKPVQKAITRMFQHLFFLTEVATKIYNFQWQVTDEFQHLFFLTEVATESTSKG